MVRKQEHGDDCLAEPAQQVRAHHHEVTRQPIGPHAAVEQEHDDGDLANREHDPEIRGRAGEVEHGEGERNRRHAAAELRHRAAGEEKPVLPLAQRPEPAHVRFESQ